MLDLTVMDFAAMNTKTKILEMLRNKSMTDAEISAAISVPVATIRRCRGELVKDGLVELSTKSGHTSSWRTVELSPKPTKNFDVGSKSRPAESRPPGGTIWF